MEALRTTSRTTITVVGAVIIWVSLACGYWLTAGGDNDYRGWVITSVISTLILVAMMFRFVPATESETENNAPARRALVLGIVAFLTTAVFWTGLPIALGIPALVLSAEGRARSATQGHGGEATAGAVLAAFAVVASVVVLVAGV